MSESTLGREPIEIAEFILPKCANVHGTAPCMATQTGDAKCLNTRATCNDPDNFNARPLAYLTPDLVVAQGEEILSSAVDRTADIMFEAEVFFPANAEGTIWQQGGSADNAVYLGITGTDLVFRAGSATVASGANTGKIVSPLSGFAGRSVSLIAEIDRTNGTVRLWEFDPVELVLTKIGEDSFTAGANWAGTDSGYIGQDNGSPPTGEDGGNYNGSITFARFFEGAGDNNLSESTNAYRQLYHFDDGRKAKPSDDLYILPALLTTQAVGTRLNLTGADDRYEPLGRRSFMSMGFSDFAHTDFIFDPYLSDRTYSPLDRGTFWPKWNVRNKFGKTRALVRRYTGYAGESLSEMFRQTYVMDRVDLSGTAATVSSRDFLSLTEFRKTQVPAPPKGVLNEEMTDVATSLSISGDLTSAYLPSGTLRINDELMTYTARTYNAVTQTTDFTGLIRGTDGSLAAAHDAAEAVQLCRRYTNAPIDEVLQELIVTDSKVPAQVVDLAAFLSEYAIHLSAYTLTTVISEPTGVGQLIGEIAEQCAFYIWWDERSQKIRLQAIKPLLSVSTTLSQEDDIIGESFSIEERPKERLTTIVISYNPRDFAGDLEKPTNFKNAVLISDSTANGPDQYGLLPQTREVFSRWLVTNAQVSQTASRLSNRYVDVPLYATVFVDARSRNLWVGDFVRLSHDGLLKSDGTRDTTRRWLIIEAEEIEAGHIQKLVMTDVTLDGLIYFITDNTVTTYTPELFEEQKGFITDNNGLNPDGTKGATIG